MALTYMLPFGNITPVFESNQVNYSRTGTLEALGAEKWDLFPFGNAGQSLSGSGVLGCWSFAGALESDRPFLEGIRLCSAPRAWLENSGVRLVLPKGVN
jgi:hypothetical protein